MSEKNEEKELGLPIEGEFQLIEEPEKELTPEETKVILYALVGGYAIHAIKKILGVK